MQPAPGVEQIAEEIRRRLALQEGAATPAGRPDDAAGHVCTMEDLLGYEGAELVQHVYQTLLKRDPLPEESQSVLARLAEDPDWKFDLIRELAASPEAQVAGVRLQAPPEAEADTASRLRMEIAALRWRQQASEASLRQELDAVRLIFTTLFDAKAGRSDVEEMLHEKVGRRDFDQLTDEVRAYARQELAALEVRRSDVLQIAEGKADRAELRALHAALHALKARILDIERRVALVLEESRKRVPNDTAVAAELHGMYDAMYVELENVLRGPREEVRERQKVYVPYVAKVAEGGARVAIDVGCGRGEFLEILASQGFQARGVDSNRMMVERCRELGLQAEHGDALEVLRGERPESCAVVSALHVVEYLTSEQLLAFLAESLRVLQPGGILVVETTNPDNLLAGTRDFHLDPRRRHPVPSALLRFLVEAKGFLATDVQPLHPAPDFVRSAGESALLEEVLFGPQDYGLIARKP